jgi:Ca2+-binding EF-hand superfamily protein
MASNAPYDAQASTNYKEAFALFDKRGNQRVQLESLGDLLRACGQNPTLQEIRELEKNVGNDCTFHSPCPIWSSKKRTRGVEGIADKC